MDVFPGGNPTRDVLDRIVPDRPVYLPSRDGHSVWVNSRSLEIAGLTKETLDPSDGWIVRDTNGEPAGTLHEGASELVNEHVPEKRWRTGSPRCVSRRVFHSPGITAAGRDRRPDSGYRTFEAYLAFAASDELTARGSALWNRHRGADQIDDLLAARTRGAVGRFAATSVKIMQDGV
jgi:predicted amidohydrolase YtcJ